MSEEVGKIVRTIKIITRDLKKTYPQDAVLIGAINDIDTFIFASEYKVANTIGKYLDKYFEQISGLRESRNFKFFVEASYDENMKSANKNKQTVEYIISKLDRYVQSLEERDINTYIEYIIGMLDNYYALQEKEQNGNTV